MSLTVERNVMPSNHINGENAEEKDGSSSSRAPLSTLTAFSRAVGAQDWGAASKLADEILTFEPLNTTVCAFRPLLEKAKQENLGLEVDEDGDDDDDGDESDPSSSSADEENATEGKRSKK